MLNFNKKTKQRRAVNVGCRRNLKMFKIVLEAAKITSRVSCDLKIFIEIICEVVKGTGINLSLYCKKCIN